MYLGVYARYQEQKNGEKKDDFILVQMSGVIMND